TESFGLFSCTINGEERDQTHRAVYRFIPRHEDELELDVDDPLYVEEEEDDYWYRGYNMRTGEKGIFPAFYAHEVIGQSKELMGTLITRATAFSLCRLPKEPNRMFPPTMDFADDHQASSMDLFTFLSQDAEKTLRVLQGCQCRSRLVMDQGWHLRLLQHCLPGSLLQHCLPGSLQLRACRLRSLQLGVLRQHLTSWSSG
ncbi:hypothetical protein CRENBAI_017845, partial [Crenichthys baileyi]